MGWTPECHKNKYKTWTHDEWVKWIEGLEETGYGRFTKEGWRNWLEEIEERLGVTPKAEPSSSSNTYHPPPPSSLKGTPEKTTQKMHEQLKNARWVIEQLKKKKAEEERLTAIEEKEAEMDNH